MTASLLALLAECLSALCAVAIVVYAVSHYRNLEAGPLPFKDILVFLNKVYLTSFLKLIDPLEEAYLRERHSRVEFREMQSLRLQQAREFFRKMVSNAAVLQNFGYRRLRSGDHTERLLARRVIDCCIPVKIIGRGGLIVLCAWRRLYVLRFLAISFALADLKDVVNHALDAYEDMKEAALMLARHAEPGMEVKLARRL